MTVADATLEQLREQLAAAEFELTRSDYINDYGRYVSERDRWQRRVATLKVMIREKQDG